ncbi:MAG: exodeoxyribonuclease VII small subunit [Ruminococcaceae bacterium]|nr:exodeoxyribonuclease VII small subunit [Oscillospiraceae bacterium]
MTKKTITFEAAMERLEEITRLLELGAEGLDESLKLYEEGVSLIRLCTQKLETAEQSVKVLQVNEEGITLADFEGRGDKV